MTGVREVMTKPVVSVELDDSLSTVRELFDRTRFHHLIVVNEGRLFGIVSDRDLLKALSPALGTASERTRDLATLNKRVHQIMSRKPISLRDDATIADAIELFRSHPISCVPIVDVANTPVGVLSWRDIFRIIRQT